MRTIFILLSVFSLIACKPQDSSAKDTIIVDVRSPEEWVQDGHADCSVNYPLDQFDSKISELKNYKHVILVCRSGNRAETAKNLLKQAGYTDAENKGSWQNINCKQINKPDQ